MPSPTFSSEQVSTQTRSPTLAGAILETTALVSSILGHRSEWMTWKSLSLDGEEGSMAMPSTPTSKVSKKSFASSGEVAVAISLGARALELGDQVLQRYDLPVLGLDEDVVHPVP